MKNRKTTITTTPFHFQLPLLQGADTQLRFYQSNVSHLGNQEGYGTPTLWWEESQRWCDCGFRQQQLSNWNHNGSGWHFSKFSLGRVDLAFPKSTQFFQNSRKISPLSTTENLDWESDLGPYLYYSKTCYNGEKSVTAAHVLLLLLCCWTSVQTGVEPSPAVSPLSTSSAWWQPAAWRSEPAHQHLLSLSWYLGSYV